MSDVNPDDRSHADYLAQQLAVERRNRRRACLVPILSWSLGMVTAVFLFSLGYMIRGLA